MSTDKVRFFVSVIYSREEDMAFALGALKSELGRYDFFSSPMGIPAPQPLFQRLLGFPWLLSPAKLALLVKKMGSVEKKLRKHDREVSLKGGYLNGQQVVSAARQPGLYHVFVDKKLFVKLELLRGSGGWQSLPSSSPEFLQKNSLVFFEDIHRLYATEASKSK